MYNELYRRTIGKIITLRILFTCIHIINGFIATGSWIVGIKVASIAFFVNPILYWIHERIWNKYQWNRKRNTKLTFSEGNPRSIGKDISWRFVITGSNFFIPFLITGSLAFGLTIVSMTTLTNMIAYWAHERLWNRVKWGRELIGN
jgi:uncharacterized membrane protein